MMMMSLNCKQGHECKTYFTCNKECGLGYFQCIRVHYVHECAHVWDGKEKEIDMMGGTAYSVTCSRCGLSAISHDMIHGP